MTACACWWEGSELEGQLGSDLFPPRRHMTHPFSGGAQPPQGCWEVTPPPLSLTPVVSYSGPCKAGRLSPQELLGAHLLSPCDG